MKTKLIVCLGMLWLLCNTPLAAQHKMVKLSNFDPSFNRQYSNNTIHPWAYTNIWGDAIKDRITGEVREYAFIGVSGWDWTNPNKGISIVDVTDPLNPYQAAFVTCPAVDQRDFVTYTNPSSGKTFLYSVGEGNYKCMKIFDLTDLPYSVRETTTSPYQGSGNYKEINAAHAHNIQLDETNGKLLVCGTHNSTIAFPYSMYMFDLTLNDTVPIEVEVLARNVDSTHYVHDVYFNNDVLYTASIGYDYDGPAPGTNPASASYINVYSTNTNDFTLLSSTLYADDQTPSIDWNDLSHLIHDVYVSADHTKMVTSDEHIMGQAIFWDVSNPLAPVIVSRYNGHTTPFSDTVAQHNHVIKGNDRCYVAHYANGLWVLDISDLNNIQEIAYYDTYLEHNYGNYDTYNQQFHPPYGTGYYGAWGVFADLPSGNILVCDMNNGLYVLNNCVPEANQSGANLTLTTASYSNVVYGRAAQSSITVNPGSGNFTVGTDANVTLIAGSKISLKPGFHAQADGKFHAQIGFMCQSCDECPDTPPGISKPNPKPAKPQRPAATADKMEFYPNPTAGQLHLKMNIAVAGYSTLSVCDQFGRTVLTVLENRYTDAGMIEHILDVSALPAGIYTLKLHTASGIQTSRFTKIK